MRASFPDKDIIPQDFRLLMRSRHIYILFCAFVHLMLGLYLQRGTDRLRKTLQDAGSVVLLFSGVMLTWAFITETYTLGHFSDLSRTGIYMSLAGVALHLISALPGRADT